MPFASGAVSAPRPAALAWSRILRTALLSYAILSPAQITLSARSALISDSLMPSSVSTSCVCSPRSGERLTSVMLSDILMGLPTVRYLPRVGWSTSTTVPVARSEGSAASSSIDRIGPHGMSCWLSSAMASNLVLVIVQAKFEAMAELNQHDIPCGPILSMEELAAEPSLRTTGTIVEVDHPKRGKYLTVGNPIKMSDSVTEVRRSPLLGEHTQEVLTELGLSDSEIKALRAESVI